MKIVFKKHEFLTSKRITSNAAIQLCTIAISFSPNRFITSKTLQQGLRMLHRYFFTSPSLLYQQCTPNPTLTLCDSSTRRIANQEKRIIAITFSTINCRSSYNLIISCFFTCCLFVGWSSSLSLPASRRSFIKWPALEISTTNKKLIPLFNVF